MNGVHRLLVVLLALAPAFWARPGCVCTGDGPVCVCSQARAAAAATGAPEAPGAEDACCCGERAPSDAPPPPSRRCPCDDCPSMRAVRDVVPPAPPVEPPAVACAGYAADVAHGAAPVSEPGIAPRAVHPRAPPDVLATVVLVI